MDPMYSYAAYPYGMERQNAEDIVANSKWIIGLSLINIAVFIGFAICVW